jgi:hypothetical protein
MMIRSGNQARGLPANGVMRKTLLLLFLGLAGCRNADEPATAPLPSVALSGRGAGTLDQALALLERELDAALEDGGRFGIHLDRAEAITDRLLETQLPFTWLQDSAYGVASMLRQIQALADRVVALRRSGKTENAAQMLTDLQDLHQKVKTLRTGLRGRGGPSPLPLDSLLARYAADSLFKLVDAGE